MLKISKAHDVSGFTSPDIAAVQYDATAKRLFATDGKVVIAIPVDGEQKTDMLVGASEFATAVSSGKPFAGPKKACKVDFPEVAKAFPESAPNTVVCIDANSLRKIADYAVDNAVNGDSSLYLGFNQVAGRVDDAVLFFCIADDNGVNKLVSGVVLPELIEDSESAKVKNLTTAACKPRAAYKPVAGEKPDPEARIAHYITALRKAGYVVGEPGSKPVTAAAPTEKKGPRFSASSIEAINSLRDAIVKSDLAEFDRLIEAGVDPLRLDGEGNPVAVYAVTECHTDAIAHMLANPKFAKAIDIPDNSGINAITYCIINGDTEHVNMLIAAGSSEKIARNVIAKENVIKEFGDLTELVDAAFSKTDKAGKKPAKATGKK